MRARVAIPVVVAAVAVAAGLLAWNSCRGGTRDTSRTTSVVRTTAAGATSRGAAVPEAHSSIAGKVTNAAGAPVTAARVCAYGSSETMLAKVTREPRCTSTDAAGAYVLASLFAISYHVVAGAPRYRAATPQPVDLAAGEHRTGVDLVLRDGAVEVTGTVSDVTGGPVAGALVIAEHGPLFETDAAGRFSIWVGPGRERIFASADGYLDGYVDTIAPGTAAIALTPASSLSGIVVDGITGEPIAGAEIAIPKADHVYLTEVAAITGPDGRFRIEPIEAERYLVRARAPNRYGSSDGSVIVGFAQHVDGIVVKVFPAARLEGRILDAGTGAPCSTPDLYINAPRSSDWIQAHTGADGMVRIDAVPPGEYEVNVGCGRRGLRNVPPLRVGEADITGLTWEVPAGAGVRGRVLDPRGAPVSGARVSVRYSIDTTTDADGRYELAGASPGPTRLFVSSDAGAMPADGYEVELRSSAVIERDLVLLPPGRITGVVVDGNGHPIPDVEVTIRRGSLEEGEDRPIHTADDGSFTSRTLSAGNYRVTVEDVGGSEATTTVSVRAPGTATVRLVLVTHAGTIRGTVVDDSGAPIDDAYVVAALEDGSGRGAVQTRWARGDVVTDLAGAFVIERLAPGTYTIRAYRRGGGEGIVEHVVVGGSPRIQIQSTGTIVGTVRQGIGYPGEVLVAVSDPVSGLSRTEVYYRSDGRYAIRELPAGTYWVVAQIGDRRRERRVELAAGARVVADLDFEAPTASVRGRLIDLVTKQPAAGVDVSFFVRYLSFDLPPIDTPIPTAKTGNDGRFTLSGIPTEVGPVWIVGGDSFWVFQLPAQAAVTDVGDLGIVPGRDHKTAGELGITWVRYPDDTLDEVRAWKVAAIDPAGPAARTALAVGDVVVRIDGIDVTGHNHGAGDSLMSAPPGTRITFGLARGETVAVVVAAKP